MREEHFVDVPMRLDHPICHGVVTPEHNPNPTGPDAKAALGLTNAFNAVERWVTPKQCKLTVPLSPSAEYLDKLEESGATDRALTALSAIDPGKIGVVQMKNTIQEVFGTLQEKIAVIDASSKRIQCMLKHANFLAGMIGLVNRDSPTTTVAFLNAALGLPDAVVEQITQALKHRLRANFHSFLWDIRFAGAKG